MRFLSRTNGVLFCLAFLCLTLVAYARAQELRTWTDATGKFKIQAKLDSVADGKAILIRADGEKITISVQKLSKADQAYLEKQSAENPFQKAEDSPFEPAAPESSPPSGGTRMVKVDWSNSQEIPPASPDVQWSMTVPAAPVAEPRPRTVMLPPKTDFFEHLSGMAVNRDGKMAVVGYSLKRPGGKSEATTRILLCDLQAGRVIGSGATEGEMAPLALHDDGRQILMRRNEFGFGNSDRLEIWTLKGKNIARSLVWTPFSDKWGPSNDVRWAEFLPGNQLALASSGGKLAVWDLASGQPIFHLQASDGTKPALSPDRKWLVFANDDTLGLLDIEKHEVVAMTSIPRKLHNPALSFSPSGKRLGCVAGDRILAWDTATGKLEKDFSLPGIHMGDGIAFPDDGFILAGNAYLIELENQLKLWHYRGADRVCTIGGTTLLATAGDGKSGALLAAKMPHAEALAMLKKAVTQSDLFVFRKGTPVKLDVSGIPDPTEQNKAAEALTKKLAAMNCPVKPDGKVDFVATVEGPKSREITYMHSGTYQVQEYFTKLRIDYQGKTLWESQWTNIPGMLHLSQGENIETKLREASQGPSYKFYEQVVLPEFLQKPSDGQNLQNGGGQTIGQSNVTPRGIK